MRNSRCCLESKVYTIYPGNGGPSRSVWPVRASSSQAHPPTMPWPPQVASEGASMADGLSYSMADELSFSTAPDLDHFSNQFDLNLQYDSMLTQVLFDDFGVGATFRPPYHTPHTNPQLLGPVIILSIICSRLAKFLSFPLCRRGRSQLAHRNRWAAWGSRFTWSDCDPRQYKTRSRPGRERQFHE